MNTPQRLSLAPTATLGHQRHGSHVALALSVEARSPVLPSRGASRQLELPFLAQRAAPHHRLRTG
ncbi:MAG: hypothetical protein H0W40_10500 [Methylibium sp.]|uniref:hypothetical protein n=1 Tax=Methylibium sp. TaxID=2067992 RepID=UPI0017F97F6B|nr:hypothetical protein [Methylibium sp.]MBA3597791.1 hypothetical protein [Methylibium sp.]